MKIAAYCRASTEKEAQIDSLEKQIEFFNEFTRKNGYELYKLYADEERTKKIAMVKFTFEQILSAKAEQVNTKINDGSDEIPITIGRKILETENIIKFIPDDKEIKVV